MRQMCKATAHTLARKLDVVHRKTVQSSSTSPSGCLQRLIFHFAGVDMSSLILAMELNSDSVPDEGARVCVSCPESRSSSKGSKGVWLLVVITAALVGT